MKHLQASTSNKVKTLGSKRKNTCKIENQFSILDNIVINKIYFSIDIKIIFSKTKKLFAKAML